MSIRTDQYANSLTVVDTVNANAPLNLRPQGTAAVNVPGTGQNLLLYSSDLTNGSWGLSNITRTGAQADPFGGTTASLLNDGTANNYHYLSFGSFIATTYTLSVYAKAGSANYIGLFSTAINQGAIFNLTTGAFTGNFINAPASYSSLNVGNGWWRVSIVINAGSGFGFGIAISEDGTSATFTGTSKTVYVAAPQLEFGSTLNTYIPTTSSTVYGTPTLSFSSVANIGLQFDGSMYIQPAGTGALQAQATTSTATGGNARGANAVDWSTIRDTGAYVASGSYSVLSGGRSNAATGSYSVVGGGQYNSSGGSFATQVGGFNNATGGAYSFTGSGNTNATSGQYAITIGGLLNNSQGYLNFIGGGSSNSANANAAVTTQSATMNGTTAVTLAASNANIKVGQLVTGTSIVIGSNTTPFTYVAAVSGTSLTLSQAASGSSTSTLSFYTPHGVVVGGGNNTATGSYSFIGGGGDAGTTGNRNVASGDWSFVGGGVSNNATGAGSVICGGGFYGTGFNSKTASGIASFIGGGLTATASGQGSAIVCGNGNSASGTYTFIGSGVQNSANGYASFIGAGNYGTARGVVGNHVFPACNAPISTNQGHSQAALLVLGVQTTDATATVLRSDTAAASTTNQVILPNNSAYYFFGTIVAGVTGGGDSKGWRVEGVIKRGANAASTALVGTPTVTSNYADAGASTWTIAVTADTTNGGLAVTFTGQASTTIRCVAKIETTEMTY